MSHLLYAQANGGALGTVQNVYKTTDGSTWTLFRGDNGTNTGLTYFWIDTFNSQQNGVYVDRNSNGALSAFFTLNNGTTWTNPATLPANTELVGCLPNGTLIAAGVTGSGNCQAWWSSNSGSTWTQATLSQTSKMLFAQPAFSGYSSLFTRVSTGALFLFGYDTTNQVARAWTSTDSGHTWSISLNQTGWPNQTLGISYAQNTGGADILLFSYAITARGYGIFRSVDRGSTWTTVTVDNSKHGSFSGGQYASLNLREFGQNPGQLANGTWLAVASYQNDVFNDQTLTYMQSTDDGATWAAATPTGINPAGVTSPYTAMLGNDRGGTSWLSVGNKVFSSTDNTTWTQVTSSPWGPTTNYTMIQIWLAPPPAPLTTPPRGAARVTGLPIDVAAPRANDQSAKYLPTARIY